MKFSQIERGINNFSAVSRGDQKFNRVFHPVSTAPPPPPHELKNDNSLKQNVTETSLKLQLHDAIYRLRFYSNLLTHILSLSSSHNNVASKQKNRGDKSHRVIVA